MKRSIQFFGILAAAAALCNFSSAQTPPPATWQPPTPDPLRNITRVASTAGRINLLPGRDPNSQLAHEQLLEKAKKGGIDIYFEGDSITRRWGATDYPTPACELEHEFLRMERGGFRLGRGPDSEHSLAAGERGTGWRESKDHRAARRHQQRRVMAGRRCQSRGHHQRHEGDRERLPAESSRRDDHFDRHFSAQRQHGRDSHHQQNQRQPRAKLPTEKRFAFSM